MSLSFYTIDSSFCDYLRRIDCRIPDNSGEKSNRPFIGILIEVDGNAFYAPLSSPKPKHKRMKNGLDFLKIDGGNYGAINFNNMIPAPSDCVSKIVPTTNPNSKTEEIQYAQLLSNQLSWCNANKNTIIEKANKLYQMSLDNTIPDRILPRCCDFTALLAACQKWIQDREPEKVTIEKLFEDYNGNNKCEEIDWDPPVGREIIISAGIQTKENNDPSKPSPIQKPLAPPTFDGQEKGKRSIRKFLSEAEQYLKDKNAEGGHAPDRPVRGPSDPER